MMKFYKKPNFYLYDFYVNENKIYFLNAIFCLFQIFFIIIKLILFFNFDFVKNYQFNLMKNYKRKFLIKNSNKENLNFFNENNNFSPFSLVEKINKDLSIFNKIKTILIDTILFNNSINIFFISIFLILIYFLFQNNIFLILQIILIINFIPNLLEYFLIIKSNFINILILLLFQIIFVYIFMWFALIYLNNYFIFDVVQYDHIEKFPEYFCNSSIQCLLFIFQYGIQNGISNVLNIPSFKTSVSHFIGRFIFDVLFFIIVVLIVGSLFLGIFIEKLMYVNKVKKINENDKNNVCFICQIDRNKCWINKIDFEEHLKSHNLFNYMFFIIYLYLSENNELNRRELNIYRKIENEEFDWLPIDNYYNN